jgi:hypothetical protein
MEPKTPHPEDAKGAGQYADHEFQRVFRQRVACRTCRREQNGGPPYGPRRATGCRPIRFVNRDPDSGTRLLLDQLLAQRGVDGAHINGYGQIEFTHAAVAAYVASGMADVSFGVEAAARQFELDFVRLVTEDYVFVCRKTLLESEPMKRILAVMRSDEFNAAMSALPGYAAKDAGVIKPVQEVFRKAD